MKSQVNLAILLFLLFSLHCVHSKAAKRPNVIFILADDLGWADVGFHGSDITTPNIDRLAGEGVILDNYYVQPICTPTRGALMSGKYPIHTGLQHFVIVAGQPYGLPLSEVTLAQRFKSAGYDTHMIGKWHLGLHKKEFLPNNRGFDTHFGYYLGMEDYFDHHSDEAGFFGYDLHFNGETAWNYSNQYSTELYSQKAQQIIKEHNQDKPLFLYLPFQGVHFANGPDRVQAPLKYVERFPKSKSKGRRTYAGAVSALDDAVQDIYNALQESGMGDNSILVFSTDNGGQLGLMPACNMPLRGGKNTMWEGGVRGVGFINSPLLKKKGYVNRQLMHVTDWYPTLLRAGGVDVTSSEFDDIDGIDQWDAISNNQQTKRKEVLFNIDPIQKFEALRVDNFKYVYGNIGKYPYWYKCAQAYEESQDENEYTNFSEDFQIDPQNYFANPDFSKVNTSMSYTFRRGRGQSSTLSELVRMIHVENLRNKRRRKHNSKSLMFEPEGKNKDYDSESSSGAKKVIVKCGPKPANATTNCNFQKKPCLFDLDVDPCEYNNIANQHPHIVQKFQQRISEYKKTMIKPGNKPIDPNCNPQLHGGVWKPWM